MGWRDTIQPESNVTSSKSWRDTIQPESPTEQNQEIPPAVSAVGGAIQGAGYDFADELLGAGHGLVSYAKEKLGGDRVSSVFDETEAQKLGTAYQTERDRARQFFSGLEEANPKSYLAGEVGGALATTAIPGLGEAKLAQVASKAPLVGRALGGTIGKQAIRAGIEGGLYGAGSAQELSDIPESIESPAMAAAGTTAALGTAGKLISGGKAWLGREASKGALREAGVTAGQAEKLALQHGDDYLDKLSRFMRGDHVFLKDLRPELKSIVGRFGDAKSNLAFAQKTKQAAWETMDNYHKKIGGQPTFDAVQSLVDAEEAVKKHLKIPLNAGDKAQGEKLLATIEQMASELSGGTSRLTLEQAQAIKNVLSDFAYEQGIVIESRKLGQDVLRSFKKTMEESLDRDIDRIITSKNLPQGTADGVKQLYRETKEAYGMAADAENALNKKLAKESTQIVNDPIRSLPTYALLGAIGGGTMGQSYESGGIGAAALPLGAALSKRYGTSAVIKAAQMGKKIPTAQGVGGVVGRAATVLPAESAIDKQESQSDRLQIMKSHQKYGPILQQAASQGKDALYHRLLMENDPEYKKLYMGGESNE